MKVLVLLLALSSFSQAADQSNGISSDIPADCHGCRVCWERHNCGFAAVVKDPAFFQLITGVPHPASGTEKASQFSKEQNNDEKK